MKLIEMRKGVWRLSENDFGTAAVYVFDKLNTTLCSQPALSTIAGWNTARTRRWSSVSPRSPQPYKELGS